MQRHAGVRAPLREQRHHGHLDRIAGHPARSTRGGSRHERRRAAPRRAREAPDGVRQSVPLRPPARAQRRCGAEARPGSGSRAGLPPRTVHRSAAVVVGWPVRRLFMNRGARPANPSRPIHPQLPPSSRSRGAVVMAVVPGALVVVPFPSGRTRARIAEGWRDDGIHDVGPVRLFRDDRSSRRRRQVMLWADFMQAALRLSGPEPHRPDCALRARRPLCASRMGARALVRPIAERDVGSAWLAFLLGLPG